MTNPRIRNCDMILGNSAVDLFWFRPARDRDRLPNGVVFRPVALATMGGATLRSGTIYSQTDRISSEIPEHQRRRRESVSGTDEPIK